MTATSSAAPVAYSSSSCGSAAAFEAELRKRLDETTLASLPPTELAISRQGQHYLLRVRVGAHQREIVDASCEDLFHAAVVVVASLAETADSAEPHSTAPAGATGAAITSPSAAATSTSNQQLSSAKVSPPTLLVPQASTTAAQAGTGPTWGAELALGASLGILPQTALALKAEANATWSEFWLAASIRYLPRVTWRDEAERGVRAEAWGAHIAAQLQPLKVLTLQGGAATYRLSGIGVGSLTRSRDTVWAFGPTLGAKLLPLQSASFWVSLGVEGQLELLRPSFEILRYGEVFRARRLLLSGFVGVGHRFR